jgi:hypothetical protein
MSLVVERTTPEAAKDAQRKFDGARASFAVSRIRRDADEFGYVTHLDMLRYLIARTSNDDQKANLFAEGAQLYQKGMRGFPGIGSTIFCKIGLRSLTFKARPSGNCLRKSRLRSIAAQRLPMQ